MSNTAPTTRYGVVLGIALWIVAALVVGLGVVSRPVGDGLIITAWVVLPAVIGLNTALEPECTKKRAVLYTLGSAIPLFGIVPASIHLGQVRK